MGLFGAFFLLGISISCSTLSRAGDIYGRRPTFAIGMISQILASIGMLISTSINIDYILLLVLGWAMIGK